MKEFIKDYKDNLRWNDPVWSKVIAAAIISVCGTVIGLLGTFLYSLYANIPFSKIWIDCWNYLFLKAEIPYFIFVIMGLITAYNAVQVIFFLLPYLNKAELDAYEEVEDELPVTKINSALFFVLRLTDAFPGQKDVSWYTSKIAVERLKTLLREPLTFNPESQFITDPIWYFRGNSAYHIEKTKFLSSRKVLLSIDEIDIKRIAVFINRYHTDSFVYVETNSEKPVGIYQYQENELERTINTYGVAREEYGMFGSVAITAQEYDDGSAVIKGKVVRLSNKEFRIRYLSPYNFLISAKESPFNSDEFERNADKMFDKILKREIGDNDFLDWLRSFKLVKTRVQTNW